MLWRGPAAVACKTLAGCHVHNWFKQAPLTIDTYPHCCQTYLSQNDKSSSAPIHGRAQDDVEHADGAAAGCAGMLACAVQQPQLACVHTARNELDKQFFGELQAAHVASCLLLCSSDNVFVSRKLANVEYGRPLMQNWQGSLGFRCAGGAGGAGVLVGRMGLAGLGCCAALLHRGTNI